MMVDLYRISQIVNVILPPGVHLYMKPNGKGLPKVAYVVEVRFVDTNVESSLFHRVYSLYDEEYSFESRLIKDAKDFVEIWDSPLAKVMRED